jgi:hypothetical protein
MSAPMVKMAFDRKAHALQIAAFHDGREVAVAMDLPRDMDWAFEGKTGERRLRVIAQAINGCLAALDGEKPKIITGDLARLDA